MLVTSRSAEEYHAMFDLTPDDLTDRRILDCSAGASSLTAETRAFVVAVDPVYGRGIDVVTAEARDGLVLGDEMIAEHAHRFEWSWYGDRTRRSVLRKAALTRFVADLARRPSRYVAGALPELPFLDKTFDLVLCSHLLFTWAGHLDQAWHAAALTELVRVTRAEVRIFPLVQQGSGDPVSFLASLLDQLEATGNRPQLRPVPYRFQRGAGQMLVVSCH